MTQYCVVYNIIQPPVFTGSPGVVPEMENRRPIEFFRLYFDEEVLEPLHSETRRYTDQYLEREKEHLEQHPQARAHEWRRAPLTAKEVEVFLALLIAAGVCGFPTLR